MYRVSKGEWVYVDPASCPSGQCYKVVPHIRNFPPGTSWSVRCSATNWGSVVVPAPIVVNSTGDGYSWNGYCAYGVAVGTVTVTLTRGGQSYSGSVFWD